MATFDSTRFSVIREEFPTLSDSEFNIIILYSLGATLDEIVEIEMLSKGMVKKKLYTSKCKLNLESVHSIRLIVNLKINIILLNKIS
ncbi:Uncharacterised protein [Yersinia frederiksenii]|nr:Uncharacterised protein [Yersinia frederiksenii]